MLSALRRLFKRGHQPMDLGPMRAWAESRQLNFRPVRETDGCLIEPSGNPPAWRMEWGASQRSYIEGAELRIIGEVGTPRDLAAMVLTRLLMQAMEKQVFEQYVEDVQTRLDTETPAEMRWLVLYPKLSSNELGRLRDRYAAVSSVKPWMTQWLSGALSDALAATLPVMDDSLTLVMTVSRARLTLRTPMPVVNAQRLTMWLSVFEHGQREARRLAREWSDSADGHHSTQPAAWSKSELTGDSTR